MTAPTLATVKSYYDERIEGKLRDFTDCNPRIEAAIQTISEWAPQQPKQILEIGCGIGASSWRMARAWPSARVTGADVSPASIQVAQTCFQRDNLQYYEGLVEAHTFSEAFDLIVLMDVYEHIALEDRSKLHAAIKSLLTDESRVVLTFPTPVMLDHHSPEELQPVDEDVDLDGIRQLASETGTHVLYYREVGIWRYGDYAHLVLGRFQELADVAVRQYRRPGLGGLKDSIKSFLRVDSGSSAARHNYLGNDPLCRVNRSTVRQMRVSRKQRRHLASLWHA